MFRATVCSSTGGQLYEYNFWYNHSVLVADGMQVKMELTCIPDGHYQSDHTRSCIHTTALLRMSTQLLETCWWFK